MVCLPVCQRTEPVVWAEFCNRSPVYRTDERFPSPPRLKCETHPPCCQPYLKVNWHAKVLCVVGESNIKPTSSPARVKKETQGEGWEADRWETLICWLWTTATRQAALSCSLSPFLRVPMLMGGSCTHSFNKYLLSALLVFYFCPNKLCGFKWHNFMVFRDTKVQQWSHWAKSNVERTALLLGPLEENPPLCLCQLLEATDSMAGSPFLHLQNQQWRLSPSQVLCSQEGLSFWGLVWLFWVHLDNPGQCLISRPLTLVLSAKPL